MRKFKSYNVIGDWYTANSLTALIPEWWAMEALLELHKNLVMVPLVNRDYDSQFQKWGDVVNVHSLADFSAVRKQKGSKVTVQSVEATSQQVKLDQHFHVSFYLDDQDLRASMVELQAKYIGKAALALAEAMELTLMGEGYNFWANQAGQLNTDVTDQLVRDAAEVMTRNYCPRAGRNLVIGASTENQILGIDRFVEARMIGNGDAIKNNFIGHMRGFDIFTGNVVPEVVGITPTVITNTVNGAHYAGDDTIAITQSGTDLAVGDYVKIAGDLQAHRITAYGGGVITITPALNNNVIHTAVITAYTSAAPARVNQGVSPTGYAAGYSGAIACDRPTSSLLIGEIKVGQCVSFAADAYRYMVIGITDDGTNITAITLNRPLDDAIADNEIINVAPMGNFNFAFLKDAITFVNRPLAPAEAGSGVRSAWTNFGGIALRVTIGYDQDYMGQKVTLDTLCGVKTLNANMGAILLS